MNNKFFICENINIFGYFGGPGGGGGGGGFNNQTAHIGSHLPSHLHVKYGSNLIRTFQLKYKL